jgi:hypothetical protein
VQHVYSSTSRHAWVQQPPRQRSLRQYLYFSTSKQVRAAASASYDTYMSAAATSPTALIYEAYLANSVRGGCCAHVCVIYTSSLCHIYHICAQQPPRQLRSYMWHTSRTRAASGPQSGHSFSFSPRHRWWNEHGCPYIYIAYVSVCYAYTHSIRQRMHALRFRPDCVSILCGSVFVLMYYSSK